MNGPQNGSSDNAADRRTIPVTSADPHAILQLVPTLPPRMAGLRKCVLMKSPAFQFYPADFLSDENVAMMSLAGRGAYITLLCYCWREGSIPADPGRLSRLLSVDLDTMLGLMDELEPCFSKSIADPSRLVNLRLDKEREKQESNRKEREKAGKKGASKRWQKARNKVDKALVSNTNILPMAKNSSSSSISTSVDLSTNVDKSIHADVDLVFNYWQSRLDHPGSKLTPKRRQRIVSRLKDNYTVDQIKQAIDGCALSPFHQGLNDNQTKYDDIELICRDGEKIEKFIGIYETHKAGGNNGINQRPVRESANARAARETLEAIGRLTGTDSGGPGFDSEDATPPRLCLAPAGTGNGY